MFYVLVGGLCGISRPHVVGHGSVLLVPISRLDFSFMAQFPLGVGNSHHVSHL
jgi:hypothetical protein